MLIVYFPILVSLFILFVVLFSGFLVFRQPILRSGQPGLLSGLYGGIISYIKRQYRVLAIAGAVFFVMFLMVMGWRAALGILIGLLLAGFLEVCAMIACVETGVRVAQASYQNSVSAFNLAYRGALAVGLFSISACLFLVSSYYFLTGLSGLVGMALGISLVSLTLQVSAGIYSKAATQIQEVDIKKKGKEVLGGQMFPFVGLVSQAAKLTGDLAVWAVDITETWFVGMVSVMIFGALLYPKSPQFVLLPLFLASTSLLVALVGGFFIRIRRDKPALSAVNTGIGIVVVLLSLGWYPVVINIMAEQIIPAQNLYFSCLAGLGAAIGLWFFIEYGILRIHRSQKDIILVSKKGSFKNTQRLMGAAMQSVAVPILLAVGGIITSFSLAGFYGVALAVFSMLSLSPIILAMNFYGPVMSQASLAAKASPESQSRLKILDELSAGMSFIRAIVSNYAIVCAGLVALVVFWLYSQKVADEIGSAMANFDLTDIRVATGVFAGGILAYLFMGSLASSMGRAIDRAAVEFGQVKDASSQSPIQIFGLLADVLSKLSFGLMWLPVLLVLLIPVIVGSVLGVEALGGLLVGSLMAALFLAIAALAGAVLLPGSKKQSDESLSKAASVWISLDASNAQREIIGPAVSVMMKITGLIALVIVVFLI